MRMTENTLIIEVLSNIVRHGQYLECVKMSGYRSPPLGALNPPPPIPTSHCTTSGYQSAETCFKSTFDFMTLMFQVLQVLIFSKHHTACPVKVA